MLVLPPSDWRLAHPALLTSLLLADRAPPLRPQAWDTAVLAAAIDAANWLEHEQLLRALCAEVSLTLLEAATAPAMRAALALPDDLPEGTAAAVLAFLAAAPDAPP